jgi:hypothetical protein
MKGRRLVWLVALLVVAAASSTYADELGRFAQGEIGRQAMGGALSAPDYGWWYGCTPTSAGMAMGYYDWHGYDNLVPSVVAAAYTPYGAAAGDAVGQATQAMIASPGHITDFYSGALPLVGVGWSGDDLPKPWHDFNCLADFMGTSQDLYASSNGSTWIYYYTDGSRLHYDEMPGLGIKDKDGMYGVYEYLSYSGYASEVLDIYTQLTDNQGATFGFTLADYMAEIDAGRVVLIQVTGHTMLGFGYDPANPSTIFIDDTWGAGTQSMTWGSYYGPRTMWGVSVIQLEEMGAIIPEPGTVSLVAMALVGLLAYRRRRAA